MTAAVEQLKVQLSGLSEPERAELAHFLITSLEPDDGEDPEVVEAAWRAEVQRRFEEMRSGKVVGIPRGRSIHGTAEAIPMIPVLYRRSENPPVSSHSLSILPVFREVEGVIWIGAVAHQRRRPGYWSS
jgi:putative addiction module component (TIGR02574 family)